ncbi:uncharacterized protein PG998_008906 [Apiospora kogelbergensis]|uniref:Mitochondrial carrier protein pet8 n=1 Tax=Apiospora kogelbergensis TaxID=1337665 RepID=A0AAW0R6D7_9PEZI
MASRVLFNTTAAARSVAAASRQTIAQRTIATTSILRHKEDNIHNDGHNQEKHKEDLLSKHKDGKGHWKPELASNSEEAVKADRSTTGSSKEDISKLQEQTKKAAEETSKAGTSMRDGL